MSKFQSLITLAGIAGFVTIALLSAVRSKRWRMFAIDLGAIALLSMFLHQIFGFPSSIVVSKGENDIQLIVALFVSMVLGMLAQYAYRTLAYAKEKRPRWDLGQFVAPVCASPIVFIPLLASFQSANINVSQETAPRLMIFLVAFQNGFFGKDFFDRKTSKGPAT